MPISTIHRKGDRRWRMDPLIETNSRIEDIRNIPPHFELKQEKS
jgi:hypothetical protein